MASGGAGTGWTWRGSQKIIPTSEATNPPYPFAWRYRDWIIEAFNRDVPYDRFVKLQLAADLMPGTTRDDMRALGYLGAAPIYHKDQRLSAM